MTAKYLWPIACFTVLILCGCSDAKKFYRGDGTIQRLKAPLFGIGGYKIQMPMIDLSVPTNIEYNLSGLPSIRDAYTVYLVVPNPCPLALVKKGTCWFQVKCDGGTIMQQSGKLSEMSNASGPDSCPNRFYFFDNGRVNLIVKNRTDHFTISVIITNQYLHDSVKAFVEISGGGYM